MAAFTLSQKLQVNRILTDIADEGPLAVMQAGAALQVACTSPSGPEFTESILDPVKVAEAVVSRLNGQEKAISDLVQGRSNCAAGWRAWHYFQEADSGELASTARILRTALDVAQGDASVLTAVATAMQEVGAKCGLTPRACPAAGFRPAAVIPKTENAEEIARVGDEIHGRLDTAKADLLKRRQRTPAQVVQVQMDQLSKLVTNMLVKNKNFQPGTDARGYACEAYQFRKTPRTHEFVSGPLKDYAAFITERITEITPLLVEMASTREEEEAKEALDSAGLTPDDIPVLQRKAAAFDAIFEALNGRDIDQDSVEGLYAIEDLIREHAGLDVTHANDAGEEEDASPAP